MSYTDRLNFLSLQTVELRRLKSDLVFLYKMLYNLVDVNCEKHFSDNVMMTRGHNLKINVQGSRVNCRKYFFISRVITLWNGLDERVVNSGSVASFKSKLDECNLSRHCWGRAYTANYWLCVS